MRRDPSLSLQLHLLSPIIRSLSLQIKLIALECLRLDASSSFEGLHMHESKPRAAIAIADKSPTRGQYREKIKRHCCCRNYRPCPLLPWKHDPDDETIRPSSCFVVLRYFMATRDSVERLWVVLTHAAQAIHKQLVLIWSTRMHLTNGTGALMLRPTRPWHCCFDGRLEGWFNCG